MASGVCWDSRRRRTSAPPARSMCTSPCSMAPSNCAVIARSPTIANLPIRRAATRSCVCRTRATTTTVAGSGLVPTTCFTSRSAMAAAPAIPTTTARTPTRCWARSCASIPRAMISRMTPPAITAFRRPIRSRPAAVPPKSWPMACAIHSGTASIPTPGCSGSAMSARTPWRKSTCSGPRTPAPISAGRSSKARPPSVAAPRPA